jgi:hypothetical protein
MQVAASSEGAQVASKTMAMCHLNGIAKLVQGTRQGPTLTKVCEVTFKLLRASHEVCK